MSTALLARAEDVLRGNLLRAPESGRTLLPLAGFVVLFGVFYGSVMGTFGGIAGERLLQVAYSAVKVPLLLVATFALSLPSFFVLNTLLGVRDDFLEAARAIIATQAGLTILLASLAPFTLLWYASSADYPAAILFNGLMFGVASVGAQRLLRRCYQPLIARDARHRLLLRIWLVVYSFVGIQMAWMLRPFIGNPERPVGFLREDTSGNAYLLLLQMIWDVLKG